MSRLRVSCFAVSIDGLSAGPDQSLEQPLGVNGPDIMQWFFGTRTWRAMHGEAGGSTDVDDAFARRGFENVGAWILGRNMFGPVRGPWPDDAWKGWWGEEPPYHVPTFVLTHHARPPVEMQGGTTFHFVTDGIEAALRRAREAAGGKDVRVGGGAATIRQFWRARLLDELHLVQMPVLLGRGESLFEGLDARALGYACTERVATPNATHLVLARR